MYLINNLQLYFLFVALCVLGYLCFSIIPTPPSPPLPWIIESTLYLTVVCLSFRLQLSHLKCLYVEDTYCSVPYCIYM
jgi:hypothetical protein